MVKKKSQKPTNVIRATSQHHYTLVTEFEVMLLLMEQVVHMGKR